MNIFRTSRSAAFRRALLGGLAAMALALTACGDDGGDARDRGDDRRSERADGKREGRDPSPTLERDAGLENVDASKFLLDYSHLHSFNFRADGNAGMCVFVNESVTCTGTAGKDVPELTGIFPGRPHAIQATGEGLRYTFLEGVPGHDEPVWLEPGQMVTLGDVACGALDEATLECTAGEGSFTINGPDLQIRTEGRVLPESRGAPGPVPSEGTADSGATTSRAASTSGGGRFVTEVVVGGRTVRAAEPSCDGRGILILESVVDEPDVNTPAAIAAELQTHPDARFATPGFCPSLRASLDGADVYPIYVDHGSDTMALCADKAARGGNARVLSDRNEYLDPC